MSASRRRRSQSSRRRHHKSDHSSRQNNRDSSAGDDNDPPRFLKQNAKLLFKSYCAAGEEMLSFNGFSQLIDARTWLGKTEFSRIFSAVCGLTTASPTAASTNTTSASKKGGTVKTTNRMRYEAFETFARCGVECLNLAMLQLSKRDKLYRSFAILHLRLGELIKNPAPAIARRFMTHPDYSVPVPVPVLVPEGESTDQAINTGGGGGGDANVNQNQPNTSKTNTAATATKAGNTSTSARTSKPRRRASSIAASPEGVKLSALYDEGLHQLRNGETERALSTVIDVTSHRLCKAVLGMKPFAITAQVGDWLLVGWLTVVPHADEALLFHLVSCLSVLSPLICRTNELDLTQVLRLNAGRHSAVEEAHCNRLSLCI